MKKQLKKAKGKPLPKLNELNCAPEPGPRPPETMSEPITYSPTVVVEAAGGGGSTIGYHHAGFKELLAIEIDANAISCLKANFPDLDVAPLDLTQTTGSDILKRLQMTPGQLNVLSASPPCQGFSMANVNRSVIDPRNNLYLMSIKHIREIQPAVFEFENVPGMRAGKMITMYNKIVEEFQKVNYRIETKVVFATEHGVPQLRKRVFIIGIRNDVEELFGQKQLFPEPDYELAKSMSVEKYLPDIKFFSPGQFLDKIHPASEPLCTITKTQCLCVYENNGIRRTPTIKEVKVLMTFPEDYILIGSKNQQYARLGNAVPPKVTQAIAEAFKKNIFSPDVVKYLQSPEALEYARIESLK